MLGFSGALWHRKNLLGRGICVAFVADGRMIRTYLTMLIHMGFYYPVSILLHAPLRFCNFHDCSTPITDYLIILFAASACRSYAPRLLLITNTHEFPTRHTFGDGLEDSLQVLGNQAVPRPVDALDRHGGNPQACF